MRNFLRFLATAMVAALLVCAISTATFAATTVFTDVDDKNETLSDAVGLLAHLGITKGTSEKTFGTYESVTRQQMAAFVYRFLNNGKEIGAAGNSTPFADLEDSTYFGYVSWANAMGIIKGTSEKTFNPKGGITLQDAYTMIVRALKYDETGFTYPFDYIDVAEDANVNLAEGLDSSIGYTTPLTRGDIAILLYNAFFAETGVEKTVKEGISLPNGQYAFQSKTYKSTFAEEYYDVEVGNFEVRATPKYAFNDSEDSTEYRPLLDIYEGETLHLIAVKEDEPVKEFYTEFEDLGLTGTADDYIMCGLKVYYTYKTEKGKTVVDKVYYANGAKRYLETNEAVGHRLEGRNSTEVYIGSDGKEKDAKVKGYLTVGNETIYFFDAPYDYATPDYNEIEGLSGTALKEAREMLRNSKNCKFINIKSVDSDLGTYTYYIDKDLDVDPVAGAEQLIVILNRVYANGEYKIKFYDVDGDGIYNYVHYMPATYGFMDGDENEYFATKMTGNEPIYESDKDASELDLGFKPTIYYNDADIRGAKFNDGDLVLAYLNPEANIIEVMSVIKPFKGYSDYVRTQHGQVRIDGTTFQSAYTWRICDGFKDGSTYYDRYIKDVTQNYQVNASNGGTFPLLISNNSVGEVFNVYAFKARFTGTPQILYYDHLDDYGTAFGMDEIIIPMSDKEGVINTYTLSRFEGNTGKYESYIMAYVNGKQEMVPLNIKEMYPEVPFQNGEYYLGGAMSEQYANTNAYVDKLCKFTVDSKGKYTIIPLLHATDEDGEFIGIPNDDSVLTDKETVKMYGNDLGYGVQGKIVKVSGGKYQLLGFRSGDTLLGSGDVTEYFDITSATRIIIKNKIDADDDEYEYLEYDMNSFGGSTSDDVPLSNIQYVLKNNTKYSNREDLLILYAEATEFAFKNKAVKDSWRIVAESSIGTDEEGNYRNYYTLLNPYTGEIVENIVGEESSEKAARLKSAVPSGTIVELKGNMVDEDGKVLATLDTSSAAGLVWVSEYDAEEGIMGVVPVVDTDAEQFCCKKGFAEFVETYDYDGVAENFYGEAFEMPLDANGTPVYGTPIYFNITDETVVSVIVSDKAGADAFEKGEFKLADISAIAEASKEFKCYNNRVINKKDEVTKAYTHFVKAYVYTSDADEDEYADAEYIIIVVNGGEKYVYSNYDEKFGDEKCDDH